MSQSQKLYQETLNRVRRLSEDGKQALMSFLADDLGERNLIIEAHIAGSTQMGEYFAYLEQERETRRKAIDKASENLTRHIFESQMYQEMIFLSLKWRDSMYWLDSLKELKQKYNQATEDAIRECYALAKKIPLAADEYTGLETMLTSNASFLTEAVKGAIGGTDGGAALHALCSVGNPALHSELIRRADEIAIQSLTEGTKLSPGYMRIVRDVYYRADQNRSLRDRILACYNELKISEPFILQGEAAHDAIKILEAYKFEYWAKKYRAESDAYALERLQWFEREIGDQHGHYKRWQERKSPPTNELGII